ncbi:MAG: hypothetical protein U0228_26360 [Myxococcaceae bacterium]
MISNRAVLSCAVAVVLAACGRVEGPLEVEGVGPVKVERAPAPQPPAPVTPTPTPPSTPNHEPVVTLAGGPNPTINVGERFTLAVSAVDPDGDALTFDWRVSQVRLLGATATEASFEAVGQGGGWVTLRVLDGRGGIGVASIFFGVSSLPPNPPPPTQPVDAGLPGVGCPLPAWWANVDAAGDVTLRNADIIGSAASIANGEVDLRVQFCERPFPLTATHMLDWCLDTDASSATDGCGYGSGTDNAVSLDNFSTVVTAGNRQFNLCDVATWDETSRTLRVVFPLSALGATTSFRYKLGSIFGGSFGANDWTPVDQLSPAMHPLSASLPPFVGVGWCALNPEHLGP